MIRRLFKLAASILLLSAASFFIAGFATLGFASFLLTWPFVHGSPTRRRVSASLDLISAFSVFLSTMPSRKAINDTMKIAGQMAGEAESYAPNDA